MGTPSIHGEQVEPRAASQRNGEQPASGVRAAPEKLATRIAERASTSSSPSALHGIALRSLLLQLSDSAFPSGAFAHSFGLEALKHDGALEPLEVRLEELVWHTAHGALPFLEAAYRDAPAADRESDVFLSNHVANRASRAQGQAFLLATRELFGPCALPFGHVAPATGAVLCRARVPLDDARHVFLFCTVRSALSAAVRLGVVGPLRAQGLLLALHGTLEQALRAKVEEPCGVAPRLEVAQAGHDLLYTRLFQS